MGNDANSQKFSPAARQALCNIYLYSPGPISNVYSVYKSNFANIVSKSVEIHVLCTMCCNVQNTIVQAMYNITNI